jgi:signal transduction histidine kinase
VTLRRRGTGGSPDAPLPLIAVRLLVLVVVLVTVPLAEPRPGVGPRGIAVAVALGVCTVSWLVWLLARGRQPVVIGALAVLAAAGGALAGLSPVSTAAAVGCVVTSSAGTGLNTETSLALTAETVAAFLAAGLATGAPVQTLLGYPLVFIGLWAFGLTRYAYALRAQQAERTLEQTRRAREAETRAAALAERARIARDIHDVLAHSLAAVSVNLQAAEGLLGELPDKSPELAQAIQCIERAGTFTREGMAEARRAILALRDNPVPLADQLSALAAGFRVQGDVAVDFSVTGEPRPVAAEASLTAFRTAQEALTNARKHAPGQPVRLNLEYSPAEITVRVTNPLPAPAAERPLADSGAGYGLAGLRERTALGGGTLTAGPAAVEWQVCLRIPA